MGIPEIPSPAPKHRKSLIFRDNHNRELPNSMAPKIAETTRHVVLLFWRGSMVGSDRLNVPAIDTFSH